MLTLGDIRKATKDLPDDTQVFVWGIPEGHRSVWEDMDGGPCLSCDVVAEGEDPTYHVELYG